MKRCRKQKEGVIVIQCLVLCQGYLNVALPYYVSWPGHRGGDQVTKAGVVVGTG